MKSGSSGPHLVVDNEPLEARRFEIARARVAARDPLYTYDDVLAEIEIIKGQEQTSAELDEGAVVADRESRMFGTGNYKGKVLAILKDEFEYEPDLKAVHRETFKEILERNKALKGNEYDAAIMFMVLQMNTLMTFPRTGVLPTKSSDFIQRQMANCKRMLPHAVHGEDIGPSLAEMERSALARRE